MGGHGALTLALKNPGMYKASSSCMGHAARPPPPALPLPPPGLPLPHNALHGRASRGPPASHVDYIATFLVLALF